MSAEERLAALRDLIATADTGGDVIHLAVTPTLRSLLDGVSVPTEPGAPDALAVGKAVWTVMQRGRMPGLPNDATLREVGERIIVALRLASQPVPAPEPSARLARAVATIWRDAALRYINGDPAGEFWKPVAHAMNLVLAALDGETDPVHLGVDPEELRAFLAATPQDPEETR